MTEGNTKEGQARELRSHGESEVRPLDGQAEAGVELLGRPQSTPRGAADVGATGAFGPEHEVAGESCRELIARPRLQDLRGWALGHRLAPVPRMPLHLHLDPFYTGNSRKPFPSGVPPAPSTEKA